jgi:hypothetical protein
VTNRKHRKEFQKQVIDLHRQNAKKDKKTYWSKALTVYLCIANRFCSDNLICIESIDKVNFSSWKLRVVTTIHNNIRKMMQSSLS